MSASVPPQSSGPERRRAKSPSHRVSQQLLSGHGRRQRPNGIGARHGGAAASDARLLDVIRRHPDVFEQNLSPELLFRQPPSLPRRGPATRVGLYLAVLAVGCALAAADPRVATAQGGVQISLLHIAGTGLFALMLLLRPWCIRPRHLGVVAVLLGTSTGLEALLARFPWGQVQVIVRSGCAIVALSMVSLLIFSARPTKAMKAFFLTGLLVGAAGSLVISVGVLLAAHASYSHDQAAAIANLVIAVGAWGVGVRCLGLRLVPLLPYWPDVMKAIMKHLETAAQLVGIEK